ncbi:hypothetical protein [Olleya aquimaris]|uniref:Uncharacterized protein n=1 Tax=Olleya aquimaris TaxID=639310 RepID=A0A327RPY7_9FLAO|nr:hypothetical protein [Olleya aquimaris]RAJ18022.1 hypothetical protein LY08_00294 [Olleya aquimaris]
MKKLFLTILTLTFMTTSFTSCREESEKEKVIQEMKDDGAEIKVKDDKIKMETEDKKVKITDDEIKVKEED